MELGRILTHNPPPQRIKKNPVRGGRFEGLSKKEKFPLAAEAEIIGPRFSRGFWYSALEPSQTAPAQTPSPDCDTRLVLWSPEQNLNRSSCLELSLRPGQRSRRKRCRVTSQQKFCRAVSLSFSSAREARQKCVEAANLCVTAENPRTKSSHLLVSLPAATLLRRHW